MRAKHPENQIKYLHGSLFEVKCSGFFCDYRAQDFTDPIVPALDIPDDGSDPTATKNREKRELDISDEAVNLPEVAIKDLPKCPKCKKDLLRPGVVWFGESLPANTMQEIDDWMSSAEKIDLMLVIGTSSTVYPAAGYTLAAQRKGAKVAVINMDRADARGIRGTDWRFEGDAAEIVPELLKEIIGEIPADFGDD
jgi:NAD+-dependent protein deacetylase sirtuin 5